MRAVSFDAWLKIAHGIDMNAWWKMKENKQKEIKEEYTAYRISKMEFEDRYGVKTDYSSNRTILFDRDIHMNNI